MTSKVKVTLRQPNGKMHHADLTAKGQEHVVDKGSGGGTCSVCFQNMGRKGTSTRVEVSDTIETIAGPLDILNFIQ